MSLKENMHCPRCGAQLERTLHEGKIAFRCPAGHGNAVTLSVVRSLCGTTGFANLLWRQALERPYGQGGRCPQCGRPMSLLRLPVQGRFLELDICCPCQEVWFDPSELESLPRPAPPPKPTELPPRAKEILALHAVEEMRQERSPVPESDWRYVAGLFGFPVEQGAPELSGHPWITWGVAALCLVVYLLNWDRCGEMAGEWGLIPSQCLRKNGLTFVTSMFLHGNLWHLAGNLYFLLIFGDNVEDALGTFGYLALLLAAGLSASMVHIVFGGNPNIPCVGASGFISGIIAAYAVFFPTVTIQICMRFHWAYWKWLALPAWGAFLLWMLLQGTMAFLFSQVARVAYHAHLGGALLGLAVGFLLRGHVRRRMEALRGG